MNCTCTPFDSVACKACHEALQDATVYDIFDDGLDDWEGPQAPEYSEYDAEAYDEMVRDDMRGAF